MTRMKEILTAVGTLGSAVGIGFVMQSSDLAQERYGNTAAAEGVINSTTLLEVEGITLTSAEFDTNVALPETDSQITTVAAPTSILPEPVIPAPAITPACEMIAQARPVAAAMVNLTLDAACMPNERVTIHHNGMIFTQVTSAAGAVDVTVPALSKDAVFIMAFSNGEGAVAQTTVEDLSDFDRVVLQWKGQSGFQIHAREYGADYGDRGHIWEGAPGDITDAVIGQGGFMSRHGDMDSAEPLLAEVYSFPSSAASAGSVALSVETEVSNANCGLEIEAQSLQISGVGKIKTQNLTLSVPECDAIGDFLVLNNLLQDLKVAAQ